MSSSVKSDQLSMKEAVGQNLKNQVRSLTRNATDGRSTKSGVQSVNTNTKQREHSNVVVQVTDVERD